MSLLADHNLPFAIALGAMLVVLVLQMIGLGDGEMGADVDFDPPGNGDIGNAAGAGIGGALTTLLGLGRVPFLVWLMVFLLLFALAGLSLQAAAIGLTGSSLGSLVAAVLAGVVAPPATGVLVRPLGRLLPGDETSAVLLDTLVGRRGRIEIGRAAAGYPARARVEDRHGQAHFVMVEPHQPDSEILEGDELLIVRREGPIFYAVPLTERKLAPIT